MAAGDAIRSADRVVLDETIRKAEQLARVEFSVFVGSAEGEPRQFAAGLIADACFPDRLEALMREHDTDPELLTLEIHEAS